MALLFPVAAWARESAVATVVERTGGACLGLAGETSRRRQGLATLCSLRRSLKWP